MPNTPAYDKWTAENGRSGRSSGMHANVSGFEHAPGADFSPAFADLSVEEERAIYGDLDDPIFRPTIEQIRLDVLAAREDIKAGRVYPVEVVIAEMK